MILFLILIVSAAAFDKAGLKSGLQSTEGQLKLFRQWTDKEHSVYSAKEKKFRYEDLKKYFVLMRNVFYLKYSNTHYPIYRVVRMEHKNAGGEVKVDKKGGGEVKVFAKVDL